MEELQNMAAEIRLRAEHRAGELLAEMRKNPGTRGEGRPRKNGAKIRQSASTTAYPSTLSDLGISRDQSSKWQKVAAVPESKFEAVIAKSKESGDYSKAPLGR